MNEIAFYPGKDINHCECGSVLEETDLVGTNHKYCPNCVTSGWTLWIMHERSKAAGLIDETGKRK